MRNTKRRPAHGGWGSLVSLLGHRETPAVVLTLCVVLVLVWTLGHIGYWLATDAFSKSLLELPFWGGSAILAVLFIAGYCAYLETERRGHFSNESCGWYCGEGNDYRYLRIDDLVDSVADCLMRTWALFTQYRGRPQREAFFLASLFQCLGALAVADGAVSGAEESIALKRFPEQLNLSADDQAQARLFFKRGASNPAATEELFQEIATTFARSPNLLRTILDLLETLAASDGRLSSAEAALLEKASAAFGMRRVKKNQRATTEHTATESSGPYRVLSIASNASIQEVKAAYRSLAKQYHPDRLVTAGLPPSLAKNAARRFLEIQAAYEEIITLRASER